jgi:hypothetical protein
MRTTFLGLLCCILFCLATGACAAALECEGGNNCTPPGWGSSGDAAGTAGQSGSAGQDGAGTGGHTGGAGGDTGTAGGSGASAGGPVCPEDPDPANRYIPDECGIWVSHSLGDDGNEGIQAAPVQRIAKAIELAQAPSRPKAIYACGEVYEESVRLPKGISLFGGYDCAAPGGPLKWIYNGYSFRATLAPSPGLVALVFLSGDSEARTIAGDLIPQAADAVVPGGSSIAVVAQEKAKGEGRRLDIIAGNGADGANGEPGAYLNQPANAGISGKDGADACTLAEGAGGDAVTVECDGNMPSTSGYGGDGNEVAAGDGADGFPAPNPNDLGYGLGGIGETAASVCTGGAVGVQGIHGAEGSPGMKDGDITNEGYIGINGADGAPGTQGQGGGGGGASKGSLLCGALHGGAGGGSGGTGGCGGRAGKGGQAGGSSIGIASRSNEFFFWFGSVHVGNGGNGGNGGAGQPGGQIGLPGKGGLNFGGPNGVKAGCAGGAGGPGGNGGSGGGGHGGHSLVRAAGGPVADIGLNAPVSASWGVAGKGGHSGNPNLGDAPEGQSGPSWPLGQ